MNKKNILIIMGILCTLVLLAVGFLVLKNVKKQPIENSADKFIQTILGTPDKSLYTDNYLSYLETQKDDVSVDTQGFDSAYANYTSTIKYTGVDDVVINGDTATCVATAVETTTNSDTGDKTTSNQKYKLTLKMVDNTWKIDDVKLLSSVTR